MISILRSNQPIAWALIPLTILGGLAVHWWAGTLDGTSATIHGLGLTAVAFFAHRIYVNRHFVDRGDSALAWLIAVWSIAWLTPVTWTEGLSLWGSLLLACASLSMALTMHRQSSTSGIQFRSGALAALAIGLNPANWGLFMGLVVMQIYLRPGIFREWAMLVIGAAWGGAIAFGLHRIAPSTFGMESTAATRVFEASNGLHWMALAWAAAGVVVLLRRQSSLNLRSQNARLSVLTMTWCMAAGGAVAMIPESSPAIAGLPLSPTWGLAMGFTCSGLVPERERSRRVQRPWHDAVYWALVGTVLVLFVQQMLN